MTVHESNGVRWRYLDDYAPGAYQCAACDRWFVATAHRRRGDEHWCPACREVESLQHAFERDMAALDDETPPREMDVGELLECGDPR